MFITDKRQDQNIVSLAKRHYNKYHFLLDTPGTLNVVEKKHHFGQILKKIDLKNKIILDIGCGAGRLSKLVEKYSSDKTIGIDLAIQSLKKAKEDVGILAINANVLFLPIRTGVADFTFSYGVIHISPHPKMAFKELLRVTKPNGYIYFALYNRNCFYYYIFRYIRPFFRYIQKYKKGDTILKIFFFPWIYIFYLQIGQWINGIYEILPLDKAWSVFHDQFTIPHASFHTEEEISEWCKEENVEVIECYKEYLGQVLSFFIKKKEKVQ